MSGEIDAPGVKKRFPTMRTSTILRGLLSIALVLAGLGYNYNSTPKDQQIISSPLPNYRHQVSDSILRRLLLNLVDVHDDSDIRLISSSAHYNHQQRKLADPEPDDNNNDNNNNNNNDNNDNDDHKKNENHDDDHPIEPHNKICRAFLKKFLQGSTDTRDDCEGLANAYEAADCSSDADNTNGGNSGGGGGGPSFLNDKYFSDNNNTTTDDDDDDDQPVAIDDFFEEFQCCNVIQQYYSARCLVSNNKAHASLSLLGIVSVLILCGFTKTIIQGYQIQYLPEAGGCILVGAIVGILLKEGLPDYELIPGTFDDDLFLFILLPPIIFHAALSIDKTKFRQLVFPITMFAIFGTILSAVITGYIVYGMSMVKIFGKKLMESVPLLDSMIFGALISSVDPVATLSILGSMGVSDTNFLYVIVFGESILNDGVSIAMFDSLIMHLDGTTQLNQKIVIDSALYFCKVTSISVGVGLACGIICTIYFWCLRGRQSPTSEVAAFFCFALVAYYISDGMKCSGIVSIMVAGFFMDIFVRGRGLSEADLHREILQSVEMTGDGHHHASMIDGGAVLPPRCGIPSYSDFRVMFSGVGHISSRAKIHVGFVADVLSNLMETSIFAYLGLFIFNHLKWADIPLIFTGITSSVFSRLLMIGIISIFVNGSLSATGQISKCCQRDDDDTIMQGNNYDHESFNAIDRHMQTVLLFSGVRGAVSLALVENIPIYNTFSKHGSKFKSALKVMTCSSILFTVFVFGASTYFTLKKQRDGGGQQQQQQRQRLDNQELPIADPSLTSLLLEPEEPPSRERQSWIEQNEISRT